MNHLAFSCYVPTYNEEATIQANLERLWHSLAQVSPDFEIVVVDDHSRDRTVELVRALSLDRLRIVTNDRGPSFRENLGCAMARCEAPVALFCDADYVSKAETLKRLIGSVQDGWDIAVGSRYLPESNVRRKLSRRLLSGFYNASMKGLFSSWIVDHQCGLKAFRTDVLKAILSDMKPDPKFSRGWFWDAEILIRGQRSRRRIVQIPVNWDCRPDSRAMVLRQGRMIPWIVGLMNQTSSRS